jgi:HD-GYP domain-containing protein (c-di-GMP phosphodiesterase class II)
LLPIIRHHHERFDGDGYPDGLRGHDIPKLARILAVCDAYDALTSERPYRQQRTVAEAMAILFDGAGKQWDPEVVDLLHNEMPTIRNLGAA